jgi:hypothetical protein
VYVNQVLSPVLVALRSHPPLMPYRRRVTIRWQSGGGPFAASIVIRDRVAIIQPLLVSSVTSADDKSASPKRPLQLISTSANDSAKVVDKDPERLRVDHLLLRGACRSFPVLLKLFLHGREVLKEPTRFKVRLPVVFANALFTGGYLDGQL